MGFIKQHLLKIQERVSEHAFGQEAIEHAAFTGVLKFTGNLEADVASACEAYDRICADYREFVLNGPRPIEVEFFKVEGFHCDPTTLQELLPHGRRHHYPVVSR